MKSCKVFQKLLIIVHISAWEKPWENSRKFSTNLQTEFYSATCSWYKGNYAWSYSFQRTSLNQVGGTISSFSYNIPLDLLWLISFTISHVTLTTKPTWLRSKALKYIDYRTLGQTLMDKTKKATYLQQGWKKDKMHLLDCYSCENIRIRLHTLHIMIQK
jgi:hypothetical protein